MYLTSKNNVQHQLAIISLKSNVNAVMYIQILRAIALHDSNPSNSLTTLKGLWNATDSAVGSTLKTIIKYHTRPPEESQEASQNKADKCVCTVSNNIAILSPSASLKSGKSGWSLV